MMTTSATKMFIAELRLGSPWVRKIMLEAPGVITRIGREGDLTRLG
jgi:hypothetical protein